MKKFFKVVGYLILLVVILWLGNMGLNSWQDKQNKQAIIGSPQGQLPKIASPVRYIVHLDIDPAKDDYTGSVSIDIELHQESDHFWLHGSEFDVVKSTLTDSLGKVLPVSYQELGHSGVVKISFSETLPKQKVTLLIDFKRDFETNLAGLYKVVSGDTASIFTQFEATDARLAFPSFDEPRFKVPFTVSMTIPENLTGIANTPEIKREKQDNGMVRISFSQSKPLPTYLVAVAVGDFDVITQKDMPTNIYRDYPLPIRAFALKGKGEELKYALSHTAELVVAMEEYFGRGYPYKKLDFIAVPDFAAGAMENAGLITYREQILLIGDNPTIAQQRLYYRVHAHELAHQWFGNLVTMPWWDDIWLNESFANWMEGKIVDITHPELRTSEGEIKSAHGVMTSDGYIAARQIREPILRNGDIVNAFDGITYQKGGAVLNMFEQFLGKEAFREGVRHHMKRFEFANANAYDFIQSLSDATSKPEIVQAFKSFLEQPGVPLVNMDWRCEEAQSSPILLIDLAQSRYLPLGSKGSAQKDWKLPMCIASINYSQREEHCFIFEQAKQTKQFPVTQCPQIVSPNSDAKGYYRWSLNKTKWSLLLANLNKLNGNEQISVNSNLLAEMRAGRVDAKTVISSAEKFVQLEDYASKTLPLEALNYLADYIADENEKKAMAGYLKGLYSPLIAELGLEANTDLDKNDAALAANLRSSLLNLFALKLKDPQTRELLKQRGINYVGFNGDNKINKEAINNDLAQLAMSVAVQDLGRPYFDALMQHLENSDEGSLRGKLLGAMSKTTEPELSDEVLGMVISMDTRLNEKPVMIFGQMAMAETRDNAYQWFKDKYSIISMFLPPKYMSYAPRIGSGFCDKQHYQDLHDFFIDEIDSIPGAKRHFDTTLELIEVCSAIKASIPELAIPNNYN